MNNFEKRLFTHILNAKVEPTLLQIAPQEDMDVGPIQDTEEMGPDYRLEILFQALSWVLSGILFWTVWTLIKGLSDMRSDKCAQAALKALEKAIKKRRYGPGYSGGSPEEQGAQLIKIFQEVLSEIGGECKNKFLDLPKVQDVARDIGITLRETADEVLRKYFVPGEAGLMAYAKRLLEIGSQAAAIRLWLQLKLPTGITLSESETAWIAGLGIASIFIIGAASLAAGGFLDLGGVTAPAGLVLNITGGAMILLSIWLYQNQPPDNTDNTDNTV